MWTVLTVAKNIPCQEPIKKAKFNILILDKVNVRVKITGDLKDIFM